MEMAYNNAAIITAVKSLIVQAQLRLHFGVTAASAIVWPHFLKSYIDIKSDSFIWNKGIKIN
jgi:hypothetical protein